MILNCLVWLRLWRGLILRWDGILWRLSLRFLLFRLLIDIRCNLIRRCDVIGRLFMTQFSALRWRHLISFILLSTLVYRAQAAHHDATGADTHQEPHDPWLFTSLGIQTAEAITAVWCAVWSSVTLAPNACSKLHILTCVFKKSSVVLAHFINYKYGLTQI